MTWKEKLTSRKFWAALAGIITGTVQLFGIEGNILTDISGAVTIIGSVIAYIIIEGKIDAQAIRITADAYQAIENIIATAHNYKEQTSNDALGIKETDPINSIDPANTKYNNNHTQEGA